jgi:hypothetical protein
MLSNTLQYERNVTETGKLNATLSHDVQTYKHHAQTDTGPQVSPYGQEGDQH